MRTKHADPVAFVESLELAPLPARLQSLAGDLDRRRLDVSDGAASANVDAGSLVSFVAAVSSGHRSDALNSTLLAQLHANTVADHNNPDKVMDWYKAYTDVLSAVGWDAQTWQFQNYQASGSTFSIDSAIMSIIASLASSDEVAVVKAALNALSNLSPTDPWYQVWDTSTHSATGGNFQIGAASDANGAVNSLVLKISAYTFTTTETMTRFLWTDYNSSDTTLHYATQTATLDEDVYSQVRSQIVAKLGDKASTYIGSLSI